MFGNIRHQVRVTVESNNPESRAIGILKIARVFEQAGIHLASDLNVNTAKALSEATGTNNEVGNNSILVTIGETTPFDFWQGRNPLLQGGGMLPQQQWMPANMPPMHTSGYAQPVPPERGFAEPARGGVPGYEHNPMARRENFSEAAKWSRVSNMDGYRVLNNAWPIPIPVGLRPATLVYSTNEKDPDGAGYAHYKVEASRLADEEVKTLAELTFNSGSVNEPATGVRVQDLLSICEDRLMSSSDANHPEIRAAVLAISKALKHMHSYTQDGYMASKRAEFNRAPSDDSNASMNFDARFSRATEARDNYRSPRQDSSKEEAGTDTSGNDN
jgi:hypothetical protein